MHKLSPGKYSATFSKATRLGKSSRVLGNTVAESKLPVVLLDYERYVELLSHSSSAKLPLPPEWISAASTISHEMPGNPVVLSLALALLRDFGFNESTAHHLVHSTARSPNASKTGSASDSIFHMGRLQEHQAQLLAMAQGDLRAALGSFSAPVAAQVRSKTHDRQGVRTDELTQQLINKADLRRTDERREAMRAATVNAILQNSEWLTATQLSDIINPALKNKHAKASRFLKDKRVFALLKDGEYIYPRYQFDATGQPIPVVEQVLKVFDGYTSFRIAAWFESTSSALNGKRPREVLELMSNDVLAAAVEHARGPMHG